MRVLVCGGRLYDDRASIYEVLDRINAETSITVLIEGGARGADHIAMTWAVENGIRRERYDAEWGKHGKAAGPIRNQRMLDEGKPVLVVAFPGGPVQHTWSS